MSEELLFLDATAQAELIRKGEVSAPELLDQCISRMARLNPQLNAITLPLFEQAMDTARELDSDGPFAGVPFLLKDLVADLAGTSRSDGSAFVAGNYRAKKDSELTRRYKKAGLVIAGKTNTSEFGLLPTTEPDAYGATCNPWDVSRGSGGSSGGSAAAVASGMVAAAHASDGGGSIRIPSSCCGLVGLKPTRGRTSYAPALGDVAGGILCDHVVTRSVRDSAALLDATAGPVAGDPHTPAPPSEAFAAITQQDPRPLRIGLGTVALNGVKAHEDCIEAAESTARLLQDMGHEVELASPTVNAGQLFRSFGQVMTGYLGWSIRKWADQIGRKPTPEDFEDVTWRMFEHSKRQTSTKYLLAWQALQACCRDFAAFYNRYDAWLTPTLARPPVPLGYFAYDPENPREHVEHLGHFTGFTLIANVSGHPAISLPMHWNEENLPIGVQLTGRFGEEALLLQIARQLEQAQPWSHRRPIFA